MRNNNNNSSSDNGNAAGTADNTRKDNKITASKLTGRQLWDSTLRQADWELFEAQAMADGEDFNGDNSHDVDVDFDMMAELDEGNYDLDDDDDDDTN